MDQKQIVDQALLDQKATEELIAELNGFLHEKPLVVIGAALGNLTAKWVRSRGDRERSFSSIVKLIRGLVWIDEEPVEEPVNVAAAQDPSESEALNQVLDRAHELGLHGLVLLSPKCPDCGQLHGFAMVSDLNTDESIARLLAQFSGYASTMEAEVIYRPQDHKRKGKPS